jgi:hypothetical protein
VLAHARRPVYDKDKVPAGLICHVTSPPGVIS